MAHAPGCLYGIGVGPGDPELVTLKALKALKACPVIAYPAARAGTGQALRTITPHLDQPRQQLLPLVYPVTAGPDADRPDYRNRLRRFYDQSATEIASHLDQGRNVGLICAGDPFFYGSFSYWYMRLAPHYPVQVIPGISAALAAPVLAGQPWCLQTDHVSILPATLPLDTLTEKLTSCDAAVIMKLGRTFAKVKTALARSGRLPQAVYVEQASGDNQKILPVSAVPDDHNHYFALVFIPGRTED